MQKTFQVTFDLDEKVEALYDIADLTDKPQWYCDAIDNLEWRAIGMLEDDLDKCDPRVEAVMLDHMNWIRFELGDTELGLIEAESKLLEEKVERVFANIYKTLQEMIEPSTAQLLPLKSKAPAPPDSRLIGSAKVG